MPALGRYELRNQLGAGAMGTVYRAWDPRLDRDVAIKIVRLEHFSDPAQRQHLTRRFEAEARAAARLKHPNIVAVHDFAEEAGQAYLVMELAAGRDLSETLRAAAGGSLPVKQVLRILRECANALDHAHGLGVVHRDVKPANLIVLSDGSVKLSDFGIARIVAANGLTMTGQTLGTPRYMAPEALDPGEDRPIDGRSDQFSLAVMAYEMMMGRRPFEGDSFAALTLKILQAAPPPVALEPTEAADQLSRVFQRALAKHPADRYPSCRAMIAEIEAACRTVQAFPPSPDLPVEELFSAAEPPEDKQTLVSGAGVRIAEASAHKPQDPFAADLSRAQPERRAAPQSRSTHAPQATDPVTAPGALGANARPRGKWLQAAVALVAAAIVALFVWWNAQQPEPIANSKSAAPVPPPGMVLVAGGESPLGLESMRTQVAPFFIDRTEVTNAEWLKFCAATRRNCTAWAQSDPDSPVVNVTFIDASDYAAWAGKRLPVWTEWEKAARGSSGRIFPWGNEFRADAANLPTDAAAAKSARLARAEAFPAGASESGTLNQAGNVWEWVASAGVPSPALLADLRRIFSNLTPPLGETEKFYQVRGGSFRSFLPPSALPAVLKDSTLAPGRVSKDDLGFRCVRDF